MKEPPERLLGVKGPGNEGDSSLPFQPVPAVVPQPPGMESSVFTSVVQLVPVQWSLELVPVTPVVS